MVRRLTLLLLVLLPPASGCTLLFGDRMSSSGGSGGNGGGSGTNSGGSGGTCRPVSCADAGANCGTIADGCGGTVACGDCGTFAICGGAGPNRCGDAACVPRSCAEQGALCGQISDGCSAVLDCGQCTCVSTGCAGQNGTCGSIIDNCGFPRDCGPCPDSPWKPIGNLTTELRRVFLTSSGLWIVDIGGNIFHSTDDTQFTSQKLQSSLSELYVAGADVWAGGADGISHKGPSDSTFTLLPGSPKLTGGVHGVPGSLYADTFDTTGGVYHSSDGLTWSSVTPSPAPASLNALFVSSASEVFAVGLGGSIYHTIDGGASWASQTSGVTGDFAAVWGTGSLVLASGRGGEIVRTVNGGATWTKTNSGTTAVLYGLWGSSATDIWAVGQNATLLHSNNGGVDWTPETGLPIAPTATLFSVYEASGKVYVVGSAGIILVRPSP